MQPTYSRDQTDLQQMCREVLGRSYSSDRERHPHDAAGPARSDELWSALAQSGILGLGIDEDDGGSGGTLVELGIALREAGRVLAPRDLSTTVHAAAAVQALGSPDQRATWLPRLAEGQVRATTAVTDLTLPAAGEVAVVSAVAQLVPRGADSDLLVLTGRTGGAVLVDLTAESVAVEPRDVLDGEGFATVTIAELAVAPADVLEGGSDRDRLEQWRDAVLALEAMELLGGAEHVLETTTSYVGTREQFGRPIGSFQAVQHQVADGFIDLMAGEALALRALWLAAHGQDARVEAAGAAAWLARAYVDVTIRAHQLHGGMGFARESQLFPWSERAKVSQLLLEPEALHRRASSWATGGWNPWRSNV